ncbi:MAG: ABC transporter permease [Acidobacteria bacterium]|nr:ABC transporter permease [Acidobacteriota bacterium]
MPDWKPEIRQRLAKLKLKPTREAAIVEELAQYLEDCYAELLSGGAAEAEAYRQTLTELHGSELLARELQRVERQVPQEPIVIGTNRRTKMIAGLWQDLRYGARTLWKQPGFTLIAIITLSLGIGANTAIFSVVNALLLRPLPYRQPERLVKVFRTPPDPAKGMLPSIWSYPRFEMLRDQNQSFAEVVGFNQSPYNLTGTDAPEQLQMEMVSDGYFPLLGVNTIVGRSFTKEDAGTVALLGYGLWQRRYGGDPQVVGKTIEVDKQAFTIVGVLPPGFRGQSGTADVWLPIWAGPKFVRTALTHPNDHNLQVIARLKDGVTLTAAQADMHRLSAQIEQKYPSPPDTVPGNAKVPVLEPFQSAKVEPALKTSLLLLLGAVGLALLIACANVANLLLARAVARQREFALRAALGASRLRLLRQVGAESLLLALVGGALGVLLARWGVALLLHIRPRDNANPLFGTAYTHTFDFFTVNLDWRVLGFNFALALLTGLLFGLLPALQSSFINVNAALKEGAGGSGAGFHGQRKSNVRGLLIVGEIALALVLLSGAGLMINSLLRLQSVNLGFAPENLLQMTVYARDAKPEFYEQLLARVKALPGVEAASFSRNAPLLGRYARAVIDIEGRADIKKVGVGFHSVSPDYFKTLGIALLRGRVFTPQDRAGAPRVALINKAAAERFFPGEDPIGKRLRPYVTTKYETTEKFVEIVGVVADVPYSRLEEAIGPDIYVSALQPTDQMRMLIVRSRVEAAALTAAVRRETLQLDRNIPLTAVQTMRGRVADVTSRTRFIVVLLGLFAGLALLIAGIGVYGVMSYSVSARAREVGIRMALGAQTGDVLKLILAQGLKLVLIGIVIGLSAAFALTKWMETLLFGVRPTDPLTFTVIAVVLGLVALLACYIPARRATKVDPLVALRVE